MTRHTTENIAKKLIMDRLTENIIKVFSMSEEEFEVFKKEQDERLKHAKERT